MVRLEEGPFQQAASGAGPERCAVTHEVEGAPNLAGQGLSGEGGAKRVRPCGRHPPGQVHPTARSKRLSHPAINRFQPPPQPAVPFRKTRHSGTPWQAPPQPTPDGQVHPTARSKRFSHPTIHRFEPQPSRGGTVPPIDCPLLKHRLPPHLLRKAHF
jgi:hypothetical protein